VSPKGQKRRVERRKNLDAQEKYRSTKKKQKKSSATWLFSAAY
jgi:hypothetical protein